MCGLCQPFKKLSKIDAQIIFLYSITSKNICYCNDRRCRLNIVDALLMCYLLHIFVLGLNIMVLLLGLQ